MIYQIYGGLVLGEGVGKIIISLSDFLTRHGLQNYIAVKMVDEKIKLGNIKIWKRLEDLNLQKDDIVIYHLSNGATLNYEIEMLCCKKILFFQNVTPPHFFRGIDETKMRQCLWGKYDAEQTLGNYMKAFTLSEFSKQDLVSYGWNADDIAAIPMIGGSNEYSHSTVKRTTANTKNFLFVGRIVPNKKIEDIIRIFAYYRKNIDDDVKLYLVGDTPIEKYYEYLLNYIDKNEIHNIEFLRHVSDSNLERMYGNADIFLFMSEHEGFGIPLVEAMGHGVPVVAYNAAAVPDALNGAGVLVDNKDEKKVCSEIKRLLNDYSYRAEIIGKQIERIKELLFETYEDKVMELIHSVEESECPVYRSRQDPIKKWIYEEQPKVHNQNEVSAKQQDISRRKEWIFPYEIIPKDCKLILYGAGKVGKCLLEQNSFSNYCNIVAVADKSANENNKLIKPEEIAKFDFDYILVSVMNSQIQSEICSKLLKLGIDRNKIVLY